MIGQWYKNKWVAVSLHVLFWTLFFISPYLLRPVFDTNLSKVSPRIGRNFFYLHSLNNLLRILLFYVNAYFFIPKLVYRKKYIQYVMLLITALLVMMLWDRFFFTLLIAGFKHSIWNFLVFNLFQFIFIVIGSTAFRIIRDKVKEDQRNKEKETENLKTELSFLRSQVSPHFMFNVLNNMVALARKKSDALEPSLIKLSALLRYMLYETNEDKVLLEKEVEYLQNYIDLQQQRFGKNTRVSATFEGVDTAYFIEPMLLVPFVENAFKHGTGLIQDAQIAITLTVQNGVLKFSVSNKFNPQQEEVKDKTSGIGLNNVKRRLDLLYKNRHSLHVEKKDEWFLILLQINLH